jgi:hypothetical protein
MDDFGKSRDHTRGSYNSSEHIPSSKADEDIARVYGLLKSKQPWGAVLDAAMASIERREPPSDTPMLSTLPEAPAADAKEPSKPRSPGDEGSNPTDVPNSCGEVSDLAAAEHPSRNGSTPRLKSRYLVLAIIATIIGLGLLAGVSPLHESQETTATVRPLSPPASETSTALPDAGASLAENGTALAESATALPTHPGSAISSNSVSLVSAVIDTAKKDTTPTAHAAESVHDEPRAASSDLSGLLKRGDSLLAAGDIASARLFYESAALAGDAQAALKLGETYDTLFLMRINSIGVRGDVTIAARWYRRAAELGASEAALLLKSVEKR